MSSLTGTPRSLPTMSMSATSTESTFSRHTHLSRALQEQHAQCVGITERPADQEGRDDLSITFFARSLP